MPYFQSYFWQNPAKFIKTQSFRSVLSLTETISASGITQVWPPHEAFLKARFTKGNAPNKVWFQKFRACPFIYAILHPCQPAAGGKFWKMKPLRAILNVKWSHRAAVYCPWDPSYSSPIPGFPTQISLIPQKSANSGLNPGKSQNTPTPPPLPPKNLGDRYFVE